MFDVPKASSGAPAPQPPSALLGSGSILDQFQHQLPQAQGASIATDKYGAFDELTSQHEPQSANGSDSAEDLSALSNGTVSHPELESIQNDLLQTASELEQARINLDLYVQARETLIATKNRVEQLAGYIDKLQMQRLDSIQGLAPGQRVLRKQLNAVATRTASEIQNIHSDMTTALNLP